MGIKQLSFRAAMTSFVQPRFLEGTEQINPACRNVVEIPLSGPRLL